MWYKLNKRGTGVVFCSISAFLYVARYISAAIFGSNVKGWDTTLFNAMLDYVGTQLGAGIIYLVLAELGEVKDSPLNKIKQQKL